MCLVKYIVSFLFLFPFVTFSLTLQFWDPSKGNQVGDLFSLYLVGLYVVCSHICIKFSYCQSSQQELLQEYFVCVCVCVCVLSHSIVSLQPIDCSPPGSSVNRIFQARILEWDSISSSGDLPHPGMEPASLMYTCTGRRILHHCTNSGIFLPSINTMPTHPGL